MRQKLLMHTGSDCVLYAGLSWQVVVGFGGVKRLQREARLHEYTHGVLCGSTFKSFGVLKQSTIEKRRLLTHHSAAACFASMTAKTAQAVVLTLGCGRWLLLAASDGAVLVKGDQQFADLEAARAAAEALCESSPQLRVRYVDNGDEFLDSLQTYCSTATQLNPLFSRRVWPMGLLSCGVLAGGFLWLAGPSWPKPEVSSEQNNVSVAVDRLGSSYALEALLVEWQRLPLRVDGWQLSMSDCVIADIKTWSCSAILLLDEGAVFENTPKLPAWDTVSHSNSQVEFHRYIRYAAPAYLSGQGTQNKGSLRALRQNYGTLYSVFQLQDTDSRDDKSSLDNRRFGSGSKVQIEGPLRTLVLAREAMQELKNPQVKLEVTASAPSSAQKSRLVFRLSGEQR